ncbi:MAG: hypothetical protein V4507_17035 [Verrucomicrobiota bacterium]
MRVTSNLFPETLQQQLNSLQTKQLNLQTQSATGLKIVEASDNPGDYAVALNSTEDLSRMLGYVNSSNEAQLKLQSNQSAMTSMQKLVSRSYELAQRGNNVLNAGDLQALAVEVKDIVSQMANLANTQVDGYYTFGGVENKPPVLDSSTGLVATSNTSIGNFVLNSTTTANVTKVDVNQNYSFDTGIVAGNGTVTAKGFLSNGTTNILTTVQNLFTSLNSGTPTSTTQITDLKNSMDIITEQLGKSSAKLAALDANSTRVQTDQQLGKQRVSELTQANMADVLTQLQKTQFNYQAALQSGARILNISLLDYVR